MGKTKVLSRLAMLALIPAIVLLLLFVAAGVLLFLLVLIPIITIAMIVAVIFGKVERNGKKEKECERK